MKKAITIEDVAREAGVCIGTVSRVINGKDRVHPRTRERIQGVIQRLDYHPSALGRSLVTRRSKNIMLLTHNIADPFCVALAKHLSGLCRKHGYKLLIGDSDYVPALEAESLEMTRDGSFDGLIVLPVGGRENASLFSDLANTGFPVIGLDESLLDHQIPCVKFDDKLAGRIASDHLLDQGHRHIAFVGWHTEFHTVTERYHGYLESHAARGLAVSEHLHLKLPSSLNHARDVLKAGLALNPKPTALIAINELVALTCFNVLNQLGCRVPEEIAVVSFGDMFPDGVTAKRVTAVSLPVDQLADRAWKKLRQRIQNRSKSAERASAESVTPVFSHGQTA